MAATVLVNGIIAEEYVRQMNAYKPFTQNRKEQQEIKRSLIVDVFRATFGEKWLRFKKETRRALEEAAWLGADKGFFYASYKYLSDKGGVSEKTVYRRLDDLTNAGEVVKLYRRNPRNNGRGKPLYIFKKHPYFAYWKELLGLENSVDVQTDVQTENAQTRCATKETAEKNVLTIDIPLKDFKNHLMYDAHKTFTYIKHVPKSVNNIFAGLFQHDLKTLWQRVLIANKAATKHFNISISKEEREKVGIDAIKSMKMYLKERHNNGQTMSLEEQCKLVYTITYKQLEQRATDHTGNEDDFFKPLSFVNQGKQPVVKPPSYIIDVIGD